MKEEEQGSQAMRHEGMGDPNKQERHTKTLAIRVEETLHAQLRFIAQLRETSITDEIRQAIETRIASAQDDPEIIARAQQARDELEREAAARSAAIAGFLGKQAVDAVIERPSEITAKSRTTRRSENE
ncbi:MULTISPECIES: hypothetical protein [Ferrimicrobium]|uniref:hypothetical protein n=1 Tax=Ferrimicrobium TaxID=121038 RepID=UPI0023F2FDD3|nr:MULTISPECIES: hypothetical protein [Ferrimicrobium]